MNTILAFLAEEKTHETFVTLPFPAIVFGIIAMAVFIVLAIVTWSYRDVANRHEHKVDDSKAHH